MSDRKGLITFDSTEKSRDEKKKYNRTSNHIEVKRNEKSKDLYVLYHEKIAKQRILTKRQRHAL